MLEDFSSIFEILSFLMFEDLFLFKLFLKIKNFSLYEVLFEAFFDSCNVSSFDFLFL